ncbi:MAG: hypothetical protein ACI4V7_08410, partial [Succinivibrionaceae bacterium]
VESGSLVSYVDFNVDITPVDKYTIADTIGAISDIAKDIADELGSSYRQHGGMYIIDTDDSRVILGKFWPNEIPGWDNESYTRMWVHESTVNVYQFESLVIDCAKKKRSL